MNDQRRPAKILFAVIAVVLVVGTVDLARRWFDPPGGEPPSGPKKKEPTKAPALTASQQKLRDEATQFQRDQKWCEAVDRWKKLLAEIPSDATGEPHSLRQEAEQNLRRVEKSCEAKQVPAKDERVAVIPPKENPPRPISAEDVLEWYPQGRTVRSVALLHIGGRGTNSAWGFKAESHFQYVYRIVSETKVVKNEPGSGMLTFEQSFHEVSQSRAVSQKTLEFKPPDSLLLNVVWRELDKEVLQHIPIYFVASKLVNQLEKIDPHVKRTLTWFQNVLESGGAKINTSDEIEFVTALERISGSKVRIDYATGIGVVGITRLDGLELTEDELTQLAHASTLLMDYYVFPGLNKKVSETWEVRTAEVAQMLMPLAPDTVADGTLTLNYSKEDADSATYKAVRGDLLLRQNDSLREQRGRFTIKSGTADFSKKDRLIRSARLTFDAGLDVQLRPDFLLFGTKAMRDLQVDSRYQAELVGTK